MPGERRRALLGFVHGSLTIYAIYLGRLRSRALCALFVAAFARSMAFAGEPPLTTLHFAESFTDTSVKLFEVDDKILEELLAEGGRCAHAAPTATAQCCLSHAPSAHGSLAVKGSAKDEAVLCTATRTFVLRQAESSNMLLLTAGDLPKAAPADGPPSTVTVATSVQAYFELVPAAPRAGALPELLAASHRIALVANRNSEFI